MSLPLLPALAAAVPLLPLLAALAVAGRILAGHDAGDAAERPTARIAGGAALLSLLALLALDGLAVLHGAPGRVAFGDWFASGGFAVPLSLTFDALSLPVATLVALIGLVTLRFSRNYLHREEGFHRFFLALLIFLSGMLLIVTAGNAALAFVGWEFAGLSSWLLIGYAYERPVATGNALFAFVANRIGDAGFIVAIALAFLWLGTLEWGALDGSLTTLQARLLALAFVIPAAVKSAQLPFTPWITRALEGPTPSSAIFYGSVMVHAGVFLLLRLEPLLVRAPDVMALLLLLGLVTALASHLAGLVQTDVKTALIHATVTQVGLMFVAIGLGWFELAAWHLGLHAAWRAYQFLLAPSYMHLVEAAPRPVPDWLARRRGLYAAATQRWWLEQVAAGTLVRPLKAAARDARAFDDEVLSRMVGMPEDMPRSAGSDEVIRGHGLAGRLLLWAAELLQRFESRLILRGGGEPRALRRLAAYLRMAEALLEQPRYLLLLVLATFAVIL
jgi:NADH:ubiquinone oxidoreductase subunit 5 (subunit L)/multisubunit Na+/H+ antiporter MnhA subunit